MGKQCWALERFKMDSGCREGHFPIAAAGASQQCLFLVSDWPGSVVTVHIPNSFLLQQVFWCLLCWECWSRWCLWLFTTPRLMILNCVYLLIAARDVRCGIPGSFHAVSQNTRFQEDSQESVRGKRQLTWGWGWGWGLSHLLGCQPWCQDVIPWGSACITSLRKSVCQKTQI